MFNKKVKSAVLSTVVAASMLLGVVSPFPQISTKEVVKAEVVGDEGSDGLTKVDGLSVSSPDGKIKVQIWEDSAGTYYYSGYLNDVVVLQCAPFGLNTKSGDYRSGLSLDASSVKIVEGKNDYDLIQGPVNHVNKDYKELDFTLTSGNASITMNFHVDNEGIAYRYVGDLDTTSTNEAVSITDENSTFILPDSSTLWTIDRSATYEAGEYKERSMSQVKSSADTYSTPILSCTGADANNAWVLLAEASVYNNDDPYCASVFKSISGKKDIKVRFGEDLNDEEAGEIYHKIKHNRNHTWISSVNFTDKFVTPWRVAIIGEDLNSVTSSTIINDLNPPAEGDYSWVVPGTSVWSWWSTGDNIDYNSMQDYIDFCSASGITYCLVDFGWENWDDYETKVKGLVEYANEKNVGILLWYGVHKWDADHVFDLDNEADIEEQFSWCEELGVKGVKVDYIESDSQFAMKNMYWVIESAARHHLVVNFHGVTDPNGESRTFPNLLANEAVQGMEFFKWSNASGVETLVTLPLTRNVIGSMEYTPALMALSHDKSRSGQYSPATSGFMLSMCINYESAVSTWAQSGYVYPGYAAFPLIADVPSTWDESILLDGYPRKDVIRARRNGENWYIGAMTVPANNYSVSLDFLDADSEYTAYIYKDNEDGTNIETEVITVKSDDTLNLDLMANGGCAIKLTKNDPVKHTLYDDYTFYEAEDAELSGKVSIKSDEVYISGQKFVQGLGGGDANKITFNNVNVPEAGDYDLKLYVIANNNRNLSISVNGADPVTYTDVMGMVGNGSAVATYRGEISIPLNEGDNTIELYTLSGSAPNVDRIAVKKPVISNATVTLSQKEYVANGSACKPAVTVTDEGKTLTEGKEYSLFYSNSIKPGTAKVYVTGINGYGGQIASEYTISSPVVVTNPPVVTTAPTAAPTPVVNATQAPVVNQVPNVNTQTPAKVTAPGKVKISTTKSTAKGKITVTYKKVKDAAGYQISYSMNKNFKKAKTLIVKGNKVKVVIKKLKSKKTYYVKVRAYKLDGTKKVLGKWSNVKKVKKVK